MRKKNKLELKPSSKFKREILKILIISLIPITTFQNKNIFKKCSENCISCSDSDNQICKICDLGFYLADDKDCLKCKIEGCSNCDIGLSKCRECLPGYFLGISRKCEECPSNCVLCKNRLICRKCKNGFYRLNTREFTCEFSFFMLILILLIAGLSIFGFYGIFQFLKNMNYLERNMRNKEYNEDLGKNKKSQKDNLEQIQSEDRSILEAKIDQTPKSLASMNFNSKTKNNKFVTFGVEPSKKASKEDT